MKKIALVYPVWNKRVEARPPLWAIALATYMRAAAPSVKVDILDEQLLGRSELLKRLARRYDIAGFSPDAFTYESTLELARIAKKNGALVVLGGHHAPMMGREVLANRGPGSADYCVDVLVRYDGEMALYELARGTAFSSIKNLVFSGPGGKVIENPVENLDFSKLPPVDYSLVNLEKYFLKQERVTSKSGAGRKVSYNLHRGCKWATAAGRCAFCAIQAIGVRSIPPETAARELSLLYKKYGVRNIHETGEDFPPDNAWLKEFVRASARMKLPVMETCAKATSILRCDMAQLKAAGVRYVCLGVESFSDVILRRLNKGLTVEHNRRAISMLVEAGIIPITALMFGLPGETRETLAQTLSELKKLDLPAECFRRPTLNPLFLCPGTDLWKMVLEKEPRYRGTDMPDRQALHRDYLKHFCEVGQEEVLAAFNAAVEYCISRSKCGSPPPRRPF